MNSFAKVPQFKVGQTVKVKVDNDDKRNGKKLLAGKVIWAGEFFATVYDPFRKYRESVNYADLIAGDDQLVGVQS